MARPAYEGVHAPSADTLEIVSVPYEMPVCTSDYQRKQKSSSVSQRKTEGVQSQATSYEGGTSVSIPTVGMHIFQSMEQVVPAMGKITPP